MEQNRFRFHEQSGKSENVNFASVSASGLMTLRAVRLIAEQLISSVASGAKVTTECPRTLILILKHALALNYPATASSNFR